MCLRRSDVHPGWLEWFRASNALLTVGFLLGRSKSRMQRSIDVADFIDSRRISRYQWLVLVITTLIAAVDGLDVAIISYLIPSLSQDWGLPKAVFGQVIGAGLFGVAIGALTVGPLSDRKGRKTVILLALTLCAIGTFGCACLLRSIPNRRSYRGSCQAFQAPAEAARRIPSLTTQGLLPATTDPTQPCRQRTREPPPLAKRRTRSGPSGEGLSWRASSGAQRLT